VCSEKTHLPTGRVNPDDRDRKDFMADMLQDDSDGFNVIACFVQCLTLTSESSHSIRYQAKEKILSKQSKMTHELHKLLLLFLTVVG
jgi:hypothetical protein